MKVFNIDFQKQAGKKFKQKINWNPWPLIHPVAKCADEICRYLQSELYVMEQDTAVIEILRKHFA